MRKLANVEDVKLPPKDTTFLTTLGDLCDV
jgi:hypothetical protein